MVQGIHCARVEIYVSMVSKYHNHRLQTDPRHREEEPQNNNSYKTSGRYNVKFLIKMIAKLGKGT